MRLPVDAAHHTVAGHMRDAGAADVAAATRRSGRRPRKPKASHGSRGRRPESTSASSVWPLPATPAMPTISPARTSKRDAARAPAGRARRAPTDRSTASTGCAGRGLRGRRSKLTARPTIIWTSSAFVRLGGRARRDFLAVTQHGDRVGDRHHLFEVVGDEDHRHALRDEAAQRLEQLAALLRRQHGGRLVEDDDPGAAGQDLQDLDALLDADREQADAFGRVDLQAEIARDSAAVFSIWARWSIRPAAPDLHAEEDVRRRPSGTGTSLKCWWTMPRPAAIAVAGLAMTCGLPSIRISPSSGCSEPEQDVHQRGLAGAVLADDRMDLARRRRRDRCASLATKVPKRLVIALSSTARGTGSDCGSMGCAPAPSTEATSSAGNG